jgi:hypothetical protein
MPQPALGRHRASGFVTAQFTVAVALSLVFFVMMCNVIVFMYARGVVRAALDEGVHTGSRASQSAAQCQSAALATKRALLGGPLGANISISCSLDPAGDLVQATATGTLPSWFPFVPDWPVNATASAVKEREPGP